MIYIRLSPSHKFAVSTSENMSSQSPQFVLLLYLVQTLTFLCPLNLTYMGVREMARLCLSTINCQPGLLSHLEVHVHRLQLTLLDDQF